MIQKTNAVLLCGGPADGQWRVIEGNTLEIFVQEPVRWATSVLDTVIPEPRRIEYRVVPVQVLSRRLLVGVVVDAAYLAGDDSAILKAVLQRDVAQHLGASRG